MLSVFPSSVTKTGAVVVHLQVSQKPSAEMMQLLIRGCPRDLSEAKPHGAELSAVLYAFYQAVEYKINGVPGDAARTKMAMVDCNLQGKDFMITVTGPPNPTVAVKVLNFVIKCATGIQKLKAVYKRSMDVCGLKTVDADFAAASNIVCAAAKHMHLAIVGVKIAAEKEKAIKEAVQKWSADIPAGGSGKLPDGVADTLPEVHQKGEKIGLLLLQHFLRFLKINSSVVDGGVVPGLLPRQWPGVQKKLAGGVEAYIDAKYMKQGEKLEDMLRVLAVRSGYFTPKEIGDIKATRASLVAALKGCLK